MKFYEWSQIKKTMGLTVASTLLVNTTFAYTGANKTQIIDVDSKELKTENQSKIQEVFAMAEYEAFVLGDRAMAQKNLQLRLQDLLNSGVKTSDIKRAMMNNFLTAEKQSEYQALMASMEKTGATDQELIDMSMYMVGDSRPTGASFASGAGANYKKFAIILGIIIVLAVTVLILSGDDDDEVPTDDKDNDDPTDDDDEDEEDEDDDDEDDEDDGGDDDDDDDDDGDDDGDLDDYDELPNAISFVKYTLENGTTIKIEGYQGEVKDPTEPQQYIEYIESKTGLAVESYTIKAGQGYYDGSGMMVDAIDHQADYETDLDDLYNQDFD